MSRDIENCEEPNEIKFDEKSKEIKLEKITEGLEDERKELVGEFSWACKSCGEKNDNFINIKPHSEFWGEWDCKKCEKATSVVFPNRNRGSWIILHYKVIQKKYEKDLPNEIKFRPSSENIKLEEYTQGLQDDTTDLVGRFAWLCKTCSKWNSDSTIIQPHAGFMAEWFCKKCEKLTSVVFPDRNRGFWVTLPRRR